MRWRTLYRSLRKNHNYLTIDATKNTSSCYKVGWLPGLSCVVFAHTENGVRRNCTVLVGLN